MEVSIAIIDEDKDWSLEQAEILRKQIDYEELETVKASQSRQALQADDAGGLMDTVVKIVFGPSVFEKVADLVKTWLSTRADVMMAKQKKAKIEISLPDGTKFVLDSTNISNYDTILENAKKIIKD